MKIVFAFAILILGISIGCSASKSAGSPSSPNGNALVIGTTPINGPSIPDTPQRSVCSLSVSEAPILYGLKLGMTRDDLLALFPGSKDDPAMQSDLTRPPTQFGTSSFVIRPSKYETKEKFVEVSQITVWFLDGRISSFSVGYNGPEWPHVDKFVEKFVARTNLPAADQWEARVGLETQMKTLTCSGFEIRVFAGGQGGNLNSVQLRDLEADKKLKERRAKARQTPTPTPN